MKSYKKASREFLKKKLIKKRFCHDLWKCAVFGDNGILYVDYDYPDPDTHFIKWNDVAKYELYVQYVTSYHPDLKDYRNE